LMSLNLAQTCSTASATGFALPGCCNCLCTPPLSTGRVARLTACVHGRSLNRKV